MLLRDPLPDLAPGYISCVGFEAIGAMVIGAFGYPGLSGEDAPSRYYCLVPFIAMQMVYFKEVAKVDPEAAVVQQTIMLRKETSRQSCEKAFSFCFLRDREKTAIVKR